MAEQIAQDHQLQRRLTNRHIQLIAIGGAIGTGLFMGSGQAISKAGPGVLVVYAIIGGVLFLVMRALGEVLLSDLDYKSFADVAHDLIGPWAGFFVGWTYYVCWLVTAIAEVIAITAYISFWLPGLPPPGKRGCRPGTTKRGLIPEAQQESVPLVCSPAARCQ